MSTRHVRTELRAQAATVLTAAGLRAFAGRVSPLEEADLPCALVVTPEESVSSLTVGGRPTQERRVSLRVVLCVAADDAAYDALDALSLRVEAALLEPRALAPHAKAVVLASSAFASDAPADGVAVTARADLAFECLAYTQAGSPATAR